MHGFMTDSGMQKQADQYSPDEIEHRLRAILRGAAKGPPTPLKDIPKKHGGSRSMPTARKPRKTT
jgi:hypothetical protein